MGIINLTFSVWVSLPLSLGGSPRIWILLCLRPFIQYLLSTYRVPGTVVDTIEAACGCQGMASIEWLSCSLLGFELGIPFSEDIMLIFLTSIYLIFLFLFSSDIGKDILIWFRGQTPTLLLLLIFDNGLCFISQG